MFGWLIAAILVFYVGFTVFLMLNETNLIYHPQKSIEATPQRHGLQFEDRWFTTEDNIRLHGWYIPVAASRGLILFFHGNTGNISHRIETVQILYSLGYSVFIFDYRGYGGSEGRPSEEGTYRDARAAWRYVAHDLNVPAEDVVIFGRSLGGAVATQLATEVNARALVVESSFSSMPTLAQEIYPWLPIKLIAKIEYNSERRMRDVKLPLLVIHSRDDELISLRHGQALFAAHSGDKKFLEIRGRHNDGFVFSGDIYRHGITEFLANYETKGK